MIPRGPCQLLPFCDCVILWSQWPSRSLSHFAHISLFWGLSLDWVHQKWPPGYQASSRELSLPWACWLWPIFVPATQSAPSPQERTADSHSTKSSKIIHWDSLSWIRRIYSDSRKVSREMLVFWPDLSSLQLLMQLCIKTGIGYLFSCQWLFRFHAENGSCKSSLMSSKQKRAPRACIF